MLRCIDPLSDAAFLASDLAALGRRDLGDAFLAAWRVEAPDPDAAALLPLYLAYRTHVRAMVDALRASDPQVPAAERAAARLGARRRLAVAWSFAREGLPPPLLVLVGPSGAGKSAVARALAPVLGATLVQSDVVRKRLAGIAPTARLAGPALDALYSSAVSGRVYEAMLEEGARALDSGRPAVLDATFLRRDARAAALALARRLRSPLAFVDVRVPPSVARARIEARSRRGDDPSDATLPVYEAQVRETEPFLEVELPHVVAHDGEAPPDALLMPLLDRLVSPSAVPPEAPARAT
jgi:predicted kinase